MSERVGECEDEVRGDVIEEKIITRIEMSKRERKEE